jgi:hypothetical protein
MSASREIRYDWSGSANAARDTTTPARRLFWGVAYVYLVLLTGTNLPTPLYHRYERAFHFSPLIPVRAQGGPTTRRAIGPSHQTTPGYRRT